MPGNVALVLGANGITGSYLVEHLLAQPSSTWSKIIATSRRPPNADWVAKDLPTGAMESGRLVWFSADLLNDSVEDLTRNFADAGGAEVTHAFWGAYYLPPQGNGSKEEIETNKKMFDNTAHALAAVNTGKLQRVVLQLGIKWYLTDPPKAWALPTRETSTYPTSDRGAFYVIQVETIRKVCAAQEGAKKFDFVVTTPAGIWGYTRQCQMTFATSLAFYAMIKSHLKEPLTYPGTFESYIATHDASPAGFLAEFNVWCATTPEAGGRVFNAVGGDTYSWLDLWPKVAAYFGCECPDPSTLPRHPATYHSTATEMSTSSKGLNAWKQIVAQHSGELKESDYEYASFWFLDLMLAGPVSSYFSMTQARKLGFTGYQDSELALLEIFERMQKDGVIPAGMVTGKGLGVVPDSKFA